MLQGHSKDLRFPSSSSIEKSFWASTGTARMFGKTHTCFKSRRKHNKVTRGGGTPRLQAARFAPGIYRPSELLHNFFFLPLPLPLLLSITLLHNFGETIYVWCLADSTQNTSVHPNAWCLRQPRRCPPRVHDLLLLLPESSFFFLFLFLCAPIGVRLSASRVSPPAWHYRSGQLANGCALWHADYPTIN